jgi:pimeloyl-ACP methyl ester carboxylesterase
MHCAQHGSGTPVLALHGAGVDHREIMGALEPLFVGRSGYRRIYPDLPGMGRTPAPERIDSNVSSRPTIGGQPRLSERTSCDLLGGAAAPAA